jgi:hypothetical protein
MKKLAIISILVANAILCSITFKELSDINKLAKEEFDPRHPILKDWQRLLRLQTGKSNCIEVLFGPGTYGRTEIKSEATNTYFVLHAAYLSGEPRVVFTNSMIITADAADDNSYNISGFMFDMTQNTNDYAIKRQEGGDAQ